MGSPFGKMLAGLDRGKPWVKAATDLYESLCEADYSRHLTVPSSMSAVTPFPNYKNIMKQVPTASSTSQPDVQTPYTYEPCGGRCTRDAHEETQEAFREEYRPQRIHMKSDASVTGLIKKAKEHLPNPPEMSVASLRSEPVSGFSTKATFAGPGAATINGVDAGYGTGSDSSASATTA